MATRPGLEALEYLPARPRRAVLLTVLRLLWRFSLRKPLGAIGAFIVVALIVMAIFAPLIARHNWDEQSLRDRLQNPSPAHIFGTDELGRDIFSRIVYGARVSVYIGFGGVAIQALISTAIGVISGYYGGRVDTVIQRIVDTWMSFPGLVLLITLISIIGQGQLQLTIAMGVLFAGGSSRIKRSAVLAIKNNQYFEAARTLGASDFRIIARYVLPNILPVIIISATILLGTFILTEASLSFLGYGVPPPYPSWGRMLSGVARQYLIYDPWLAIWPGLFISLAVYGFNMLGDALRDVLDPRMRGVR